MSQPSGTVQAGDYSYSLAAFDVADEGARAHVLAQHRAVTGLSKYQDYPGSRLRHRYDVHMYKAGGTTYDYHYTATFDDSGSKTTKFSSTVVPGQWIYSASSMEEQGYPSKGDKFEAFASADTANPLSVHVIDWDFYGINTRDTAENAGVSGAFVEQFHDETLSEYVQLADHSAGNEMYAPYEFISSWHMRNLYANTYNRLCYDSVSAYSFPVIAGDAPVPGD